MGGKLEPAYEQNPLEVSTLTWIQVRFSFRRLIDDRVCIAGFIPDLAKLPEQERLIWWAYQIEAPVFVENDPAFNRWVERYLNASCEADDGPKPKILSLLRLIRAATQQTLGSPLFKFEDNPLINYPVAENTDAYAKAHLELYRLIVDGLDVAVLERLATKLHRPLSKPSARMRSLKEILPSELVSKIYDPIEKCYNE